MGWFRKKKFEVEAPSNDSRRAVAWADSSLYAAVDFERYNPDELITNRGTTIYKKMMMDEQVKAAVKFRRDAITSRNFSFVIPEGHDLSDEEVDKRLEIIESIIRQYKGSFVDGFNLIMTSLYNGFSLVEKIFDTVEIGGVKWWGIKGLFLRPFDSFIFKIDDYDQLVGVVQRSSTGQETEHDPEKFIHHVQNPEVDRYYGQSELKEAYRAWYSKDVVIKLQNIWLERHAGGVRTIQGVNGKTILPGSQEYSQLQTILQSIQAGATGIILPTDVEMDAQYPTGKVEFSGIIDKYDLMISRALLVPNLLGVTPSGQTGSYAQSDTQLEAFLWTLDADTARLEESLNEQLLSELGKYNWGDEYYPRLRFEPISERKKFELVNAWADLVSKGAATRTDSDEKHVRDLLEFPEKEETEGPAAGPTEPPIPPDQPPPMQPGLSPDGQPMEETVIGRPWSQYQMAVKRAEARVDFKVIDKRTNEIELSSVDDVTQYTDKIVTDVWGQYFGGKKVTDLKADGRVKRKLNSTMKRILKEHWRIGEDHAKKEVDKAKGQAFSMQFDRKRMEFALEEYIDLESFSIAGKLADDIVAKIRQIIVDGERTDKTHAEMKTQIYDTLATEGVISQPTAEEELGELLGTKNASSRVDTIIRTSGFKAVNEARYNYFTDPGMGGFVQAFEYSAILDERTTSICDHLHGQVHDAKSPVWNEYRPPNHFNCRSVLVPVTAVDDWTEDKPPTIEPQQGFK